MTALALRTEGLRKRYRGIDALAGLDLAVPTGSICGLVGPNGAGKTTAFAVVAGLLRADAGRVDVLGAGPFDPHVHAGRLGLLPQDCELSRHTTARDLLTYYARLQGMDRTTARRCADGLLEQVELAERRDARVQQLSHGMRRRLQVAQAFIGDPELILLDEPMSGLDPELAIRMRRFFTEQRGARTLVISSHNLLELEAICDHVIFVAAGRCVRAGPLAEITGRGLLMRYELETALDLTRLRELPDGFRLKCDDRILLAEAPPGCSAADTNAVLIPLLARAGARIIEIRAGQSLEATYMATRAR
jgi:ABC-type multidrug transport system ATPase subunit